MLLLCAQDVKETLNRKLYARVNLCNAAGFQVRQRERQLQTLQDRLAAMGKLSTPDETGVQEQQWIRQLENSTEKMLIKAAAAKKLQVTYMKILEFLQEEVRRMPLVVSEAEAALKTHSAELQTLTQITQDATADMQHAKMALDGLEQDYTEERKARDISLAMKKKMGAAEKLCYKDIAEKSMPRRVSEGGRRGHNTRGRAGWAGGGEGEERREDTHQGVGGGGEGRRRRGEERGHTPGGGQGGLEEEEERRGEERREDTHQGAGRARRRWRRRGGGEERREDTHQGAGRARRRWRRRGHKPVFSILFGHVYCTINDFK
ncbi:UNVERIFIED_CONTAM: hypothetical protein FKN15_044122 [Acipenser sinensis]